MEAKLIWSEIKKGANGFPKKSDNEIEVFAEEKEVVRTEFYEAMRNGISVKKILIVRLEDFELSKHKDENGNMEYANEIIYEDVRYKIIRTFSRNKSKVELTCAEV